MNPSASLQDIERLMAEVKRLDEALKQSNAAREREKTALVEQVAKMIDEMQRRATANSSRTTPTIALTPAPTPTDGAMRHTVKAGENLTVIAKSYGVTVSDLKKANRLSNDLLQVGQVLVIPKAP
jgi:N-acetylmuramoyl-L-alanine amidase